MESRDIIKVTNSLTKASDCREDTAILTQANANWEEYLTPAPISIAFLGELVFISSQQDYSIKEGGPLGGFKYIKYPDSFRACLMQVCNSGWRAFNEAHKSMDKISMHTSIVPAYVKRAVQILLQEDDELVKCLLPDTLESIASISKNCVTLAMSVEKKFDDVTELISELLETCMSAKQHYGSSLENVRRKLEEEKLKKSMLEQEHREAEKQFKKMGKQIDEANQTFQKAMDSLPSGWDCIQMDFVQGLTNAIPNFLGGLTNAMIGSINAGEQAATTESCKTQYATNDIFCNSSLLLNTSQSLSGLIRDNQIDWTKVFDVKTNTSQSNWWKERIQDLLSRMEDKDPCPAKSQAKEICQKAMKICYDLTAMFSESKHGGKEKNEHLIEMIKNLHRETQRFDTSAKKETKISSFPVNAPGKAKAESSTSQSASKMAQENAHLRIEQTRAQLDTARERYEKSLEKMEKRNRELTTVLCAMRSTEVQTIDFETALTMLTQGLTAMGTLQENWRKMVKFFQMVSAIIDSVLKKSLEDFVKTADKPNLKEMTYSSKMFIKDMIYQQAFQASNIANMVNMISSTYTEISSKYLMDAVGSLGRLMTLDPKDHKFNLERVALAESCDDAENKIRELVLENKERYMSRTKARLENIERELNAVLPPPSKEEQKNMMEIVAAGFQGVKESDLQQFE